MDTWENKWIVEDKETFRFIWDFIFNEEWQGTPHIRKCFTASKWMWMAQQKKSEKWTRNFFVCDWQIIIKIHPCEMALVDSKIVIKFTVAYLLWDITSSLLSQTLIIFSSLWQFLAASVDIDNCTAHRSGSINFRHPRVLGSV